jgi:hypothetical protein
MLLEQCDEGDVEAVTNAYGVRWRQQNRGGLLTASVSDRDTNVSDSATGTSPRDHDDDDGASMMIVTSMLRLCRVESDPGQRNARVYAVCRHCIVHCRKSCQHCNLRSFYRHGPTTQFL